MHTVVFQRSVLPEACACETYVILSYNQFCRIYFFFGKYEKQENRTPDSLFNIMQGFWDNEQNWNKMATTLQF